MQYRAIKCFDKATSNSPQERHCPRYISARPNKKCLRTIIDSKVPRNLFPPMNERSHPHHWDPFRWATSQESKSKREQPSPSLSRGGNEMDRPIMSSPTIVLPRWLSAGIRCRGLSSTLRPTVVSRVFEVLTFDIMDSFVTTIIGNKKERCMSSHYVVRSTR